MGRGQRVYDWDECIQMRWRMAMVGHGWRDANRYDWFSISDKYARYAENHYLHGYYFNPGFWDQAEKQSWIPESTMWIMAMCEYVLLLVS